MLKKMKSVSIAAFAAVLLSALTSGGAETLVLARRGASAEFKVAFAENAGPSVRYAAEELVAWTERLTGMRLGLVRGLPDEKVIALRMTDAYGEDGFRLRTKGGNLLVEGGVRGVLYGVYELLETYGGIGWFSPERTVVPRADAFAVPADLDVTEKPAFELREPLWYVAFENADYAARLRLNGNSPRLTDRHGGKSHRFGGGLGSCHTFAKLVPVEKYGKTHPEYFAMRGDVRRTEGDPQTALQLCLTNPDVLRIVTEGVLDAIRRDPTAKYYGISQNDNKSYCECPACAAVDAEEESHAGSQMRFVNAVAEAVEREFPDKIIETLAYQYTRKPPKMTRLRRNVMPCLCTIECDFAHPIETGKSKANAAFREDIQGWAKQTDRLYIWDYTTDYRHFPGVFPNFDVLQANIRFFHKCGTVSLFEQGAHVGRGAEFEALKSWLIAKWMWNPDLDEKSLLDRFFRGYYGAAAPYARRYFDELRAFERPDGKFSLGCFADVVSQDLVTDEFLVRARGLWDQAEAAVKESDPGAWTNVLYGAFSVDYVRYQRLKGACAGTANFSVRRVSPSDDPASREIHAIAGRLVSLMDAVPRIVFCESRKSKEVEAEIRRVAGGNGLAKAFVPSDRVTLEECALSLCGEGNWCQVVEDPTASGGKALKFMTTDHQWCAQMQVPFGAFDEDVSYRLRVRAKFAKRPNAPDAEILWAGVYDPSTPRSVAEWRKTASQVRGGDWEWVDVGTWVPTRTQGYLWMASGRFDRKTEKSNPALEALYVDQFEFVRTADPISLDAGHGVRILDLGPEGTGGYAEFNIGDFTRGEGGAAPVLRISYACHPDGLGEKGDFWKETAATYLGKDVQLPIFPANVDRYELYTVDRRGHFRAPLLQGLVRYVRFALDTPGASVRVEDFRLVNDRVHSEGERAGSFECSDPMLNKVWEASVRTCELSAIPSYVATNVSPAVTTLPYLADGAKRDRLVWSGDLWWAERNVFFGFRPGIPYMKGSIEMLAANQTPEGYVQASPWPEQPKPKSREWGPFQSDEFAAWFVPVLADYVLYTGDRATAKEQLPAVRRLLGYLKAHCRADGIFEQRLETSKHASSLAFGSNSTNHRAYMDVLLWKTFVDAAQLAEWTDDAASAQGWRTDAAKLADAIRRNYWDPSNGWFREALEKPDAFGWHASALAMAAGFVTADEAEALKDRFARTGHGKFQALGARGLFACGYPMQALKLIAEHGWYGVLKPDWKGLHLTSECMGLIRRGWGDEAHPDTAIAGILSNYILGAEPLEPGWRRFRVRPRPACGITWAKGTVPTPSGEIRISWKLVNGKPQAEVSAPSGLIQDVIADK